MATSSLSDGDPDPPLRGTTQFNTTVGTGAGVLANDGDVDGDLFTAVLVAEPANGSLAFSHDGTFSYTPDEDFVGTDTFTDKINDGQIDSNTATVEITVEAPP